MTTDKLKVDAIIDTCDHGHRFAKLDDHPRNSCVHCLRIGLARARAEVERLGEQGGTLVEALEAMLAVRVIEADVNYGLACVKAEQALAAYRKGGK